MSRWKSPLQAALGTSWPAKPSRVLQAHAFGGSFSGSLEVTGSGNPVVRGLLENVFGMPSQTGQQVPVSVAMRQSRNDSMIFDRDMNGQRLKSTWSYTDEQGLIDTFDGGLIKMRETVILHETMLEILVERLMPFPSLLLPVRIYTSVDERGQEPGSFQLTLTVDDALMKQHLFGYRGLMKVESLESQMDHNELD